VGTGTRGRYGTLRPFCAAIVFSLPRKPNKNDATTASPTGKAAAALGFESIATTRTK
jgi:hypothetical protein